MTDANVLAKHRATTIGSYPVKGAVASPRSDPGPFFCAGTSLGIAIYAFGGLMLFALAVGFFAALATFVSHRCVQLLKSGIDCSKVTCHVLEGQGRIKIQRPSPIEVGHKFLAVSPKFLKRATVSQPNICANDLLHRQ